MKLELFNSTESKQTISLFARVFSESEGEQEGRVLGEFVTKLIHTTPPKDLLGCVAKQHGEPIACVFFSRLTAPSGQTSFILSPMAVATKFQKQGVGQQLIRFGLEQLKLLGAELVFTYGDPAYYCKTGFAQISQETIKAPFPLSQPIGWLAQSLDGAPIKPMSGSVTCIDALNDPSLW